MTRSTTKTATTADMNLTVPADEIAALIAAEHARFPRLAATAQKWRETFGDAVPAVRITAKEDGFRRAGMVHTGTRDFPITAFDPERLEQLLGERLLIVEFVEIDGPLAKE